MTNLKPVNKKAVEHNLATGLKKALHNGDVKALHKAAQDVVDAGYELEDMKILPGMLTIIMNELIRTGFVPRYNNEF